MKDSAPARTRIPFVSGTFVVGEIELVDIVAIPAAQNFWDGFCYGSLRAHGIEDANAGFVSERGF